MARKIAYVGLIILFFVDFFPFKYPASVSQNNEKRGSFEVIFRANRNFVNKLQPTSISSSITKSVKIRLVVTCHLQTFYNLLKKATLRFAIDHTHNDVI